MRTVLFWVTMQRVVVSSYRRCCRTTYWSHLQESRIFFPPGPDSFPHPCSLLLLSLFLFFSISLPFLLSFFSPSPSMTIYQFLHLLLLLLFFVTCYFTQITFLCFLYYSNTSPSIPLHLSLVPTEYPPPSISVLLNCSLFSSLSSFRFFSCPFSPHYYVSFCLLTLHVIILPERSAGLWILPPPTALFLFILLFITIYCTDFYLFVLVF